MSVHAQFPWQGQAVLAGPAETVFVCLSALGHCGWGKACISILEILVSPFGNSSLQGSMQSLDGESTW